MDEWFFCVVPELPPHIPGQTNMVEVIKYAVVKGGVVEANKPVAVVKAGDTLLAVLSTVKAKVKDHLSAPGEMVRVGNPVAMLVPMSAEETKGSAAQMLHSRSAIAVLKK